ncbi:MAG TPA: D-alanyl-D-alanine carboxypeptidase/D-alanyl-D-alanine-endopeptidase [Terriglobales bacterium]|nr:D-alanyl-D-alanine carboxypeptidase/D-alanyl-D-alanine-endopeptidase [Terriglobales bacterium]
MSRLRAFLAMLLLLSLLPAPAAARRKPKPEERQKALAARIDRILAEPEAGRAFWGIEVRTADGQPLYAHNSDKLFTPASNTKLFTTAAALALIGPDYKFQTTVETAGALDTHGRLVGDLVLVGRGDPNLSGRDLPFHIKTQRDAPADKVLEDLADQIVQKGVKFVDGDLVGDDSFYAFERYGEGWSQEDLATQWGAPVSALTINDNVLTVKVLPGDRPGEKAFVAVDPFADYYQVDNRIITTPPGTGPRRVDFRREPGSDRLVLWGYIPVDDPGGAEQLAIEDPAQFAAELFRTLLEKRGVTIYGKTRARHTELASLSTFSVTTLAPASGGPTRSPSSLNPPLVLASHQSQALLDDLTVTNKVSQNLHAELLLRLLGREKGTTGTIEGGLEVVKGFLAQAGVSSDDYFFADGSGLSRLNLVAPRAVVRLLQYATTQPWGQQFRDTLPVAGEDGTLVNRLKTPPAAGRVVAKSGALGHVSALSGYATTASGQQLIFSILVNNTNQPGAHTEELIDRVVQAMLDDTPPAKKK